MLTKKSDIAPAEVDVNGTPVFRGSSVHCSWQLLLARGYTLGLTRGRLRLRMRLPWRLVFEAVMRTCITCVNGGRVCRLET